MVVLPATVKINLEGLKKATGAHAIKLANEHDFEDKFPGCELGAMPPFGNLFHMDVYVDKTLAKDEYIAFNAGTHSELIRLSYVDFVKLVHPHVLQWN